MQYLIRSAIIWLSLTLINAEYLSAARFPTDPLVYPVFIANLSGPGTGSGCFLRLSNSVYLITARHVLFGSPTSTNLGMTNVLLKEFGKEGTNDSKPALFSMDLGVL